MLKEKTEMSLVPTLYIARVDHAIIDYPMFVFLNLFLLIVYFSTG
jgi:hypothetical protein